MPSAFDVAAHIVERIRSDNRWRVQKLMYYAQAWSLALRDRPLFTDPFQAWVDGPVQPDVEREMNHRRATAFSATRPLPIDDVDHVEDILRLYGTFTTQELIDMTHRETPWLAARGDLSPKAKSSTEIPRESMRDFYRAQKAEADESNAALKRPAVFSGSPAEFFARHGL